MEAQAYLEKNFMDQQITEISLPANSPKITGDLLIQDYPNLTEINLKNQELTTLTIINCPQLKKINVRNNQLTKLELEKIKVNNQGEPLNNEIEELIAGSNELKTLDLTMARKIRRIILPDNPQLTEIKQLNLHTVQEINLTNSPPASYLEDYAELKQQNETLFEMLLVLGKAERDKKLTLSEPIRTLRQTDQAIQRLLKEIEHEWREYFESEDPLIADKKFELGLSFRDPQERQRGKKVLGWIIEARVNGNYEDLVKRWNDGDDYKPEYDYDGNLEKLMQYLKVRELALNSENK